MFLGLRMTEGISIENFRRRFGQTADRILSADQSWMDGELLEEQARIPALHAQRAFACQLDLCAFHVGLVVKQIDGPRRTRSLAEKSWRTPMADNSLDKIRIDHIGSLVRPAKLKEVFRPLRPRASDARRIGKSARRRNPRSNPKTRSAWLSRRHRRRVSPPQLSGKFFAVRHRLRRAKEYFPLLRKARSQRNSTRTCRAELR